MPKTRLLKAVIGAAMLAGAVGNVQAADQVLQGGTVHFIGEIVEATCAVSTESSNQTVNLGQYRKSHFAKAGDKSDAVPFTIKFEDCEPGAANATGPDAKPNKVSVAFNGATTATNDKALSVSNIGNGAAGAAAGVGVEISDSVGAVLGLDGTDFSKEMNLINGANVMNFNARYIATASDITPGAADADATFIVKYN